MPPQQLTAELLVLAYRHGYFPMGEPETDSIAWFSPDPRAILPLDRFHIPRSLRRTLRQEPFALSVDAAFPEVIRACAEREATWITDEILRAYLELHRLGLAHSIECWQDRRLAGGLYGVAIGAAFFGESMVSRVSQASKVALVHLVRVLREGGFALLDIQFLNQHLLQFGAIEVSRERYLALLAQALEADGRFPSMSEHRGDRPAP